MRTSACPVGGFKNTTPVCGQWRVLSFQSFSSASFSLPRLATHPCTGFRLTHVPVQRCASLAGPCALTIRSTAGVTLLDGSEWISFPSQWTISPGMSYGT